MRHNQVGVGDDHSKFEGIQKRKPIGKRLIENNFGAGHMTHDALFKHVTVGGDDGVRPILSRGFTLHLSVSVSETELVAHLLPSRRGQSHVSLGSTPLSPPLIRRTIGPMVAIERTSGIGRKQSVHDRRNTLVSQIPTDIRSNGCDQVSNFHGMPVGLAGLEDAVHRANATNGSLLLAFIEVDEPDVTLDLGGFLSYQERLRRTANIFQGQIRSGDLMVHYRSGVFLCSLPGLTVPEAERRSAQINKMIGVFGASHITAGFALLRRSEGLSSLIRRADENLNEKKKHNKQWEFNGIAMSTTWRDESDVVATARCKQAHRGHISGNDP